MTHDIHSIISSIVLDFIKKFNKFNFGLDSIHFENIEILTFSPYNRSTKNRKRVNICFVYVFKKKVSLMINRKKIAELSSCIKELENSGKKQKLYFFPRSNIFIIFV